MSVKLKPYPAYKDSGVGWLGRVPANWAVSPGLAAFREKQKKNFGMAERTVLSLSYGKIVVKPPEKLHGLVPESFETYQIVEPGDIIVRSTDLQNDWNSLRVGLVRNRGIITSAYLCLAMRGPLTPEFGYWLLHAYDLNKVFYGLGSGLRQNLGFVDFKRMAVLLPREDEQAAIVRFLTAQEQRIAQLIRVKRRLIEVLNEQKQAIIQRAVTRGLDPAAPLKPSGIPWLGDIPAHWEAVQLRRLVSLVTSGSRGWAEYYSDSGDVFLQSGNLGRGMALNLSFIQHVRTPAGAEGARTKVKRDDVLVCITGALTGNVVVVDVDFPAAYVNQHVALVRPKRGKVDPRFLAYVLHSGIGQSQFKTSEYGGTKQGLGLGDVKAVCVPLPSLDEQVKIVAELDRRVAELSRPIADALREIDLIREYRTRLVSDVVTGKLDVRGVAVSELATESSKGALDELEIVDAEADETEVAEG